LGVGVENWEAAHKWEEVALHLLKKEKIVSIRMSFE
jgi:hypothetical protein